MIYLVRHGETDWNLFKRCNGSTDTYLNQTGIKQAMQQAEKLKLVTFDICFSSPLTRARQFCEIIYHDNVVFDDRLKEIECGDFEGLEETPEMMSAFWQAIKTGDKGTEQFHVFIKRNCDLCDLIDTEYKGRNVLIVTHAANARVINYYFTGKPADYNFMQTVCANNEYLTFEN